MALSTYPIGMPGQVWGAAETALWRSRQQRQRSYADDVLRAIDGLRDRFDVLRYGEISYDAEHFPLMALRSRGGPQQGPHVLITGGVHGYETSGVQAALRFLDAQAQTYSGRMNLLVVPCVSPWAYERIQRWNFEAIDPNRSFKEGSTVQEAAALMLLLASQHSPFTAHFDLHETTNSDETEFRPALAARDGKAFEPGRIPEGFYLVADAANPQLAFQQAIIAAVSQAMPIAAADENNEIIGAKVVAPGVIQYEMQALGLCASVSGARYTTTTEVSPDSPRTSPQQCIMAQIAAVCAGLDFLIQHQ
jgi:Succinylglutamate desuccinylase / Aspartoacylase family